MLDKRSWFIIDGIYNLMQNDKDGYWLLATGKKIKEKKIFGQRQGVIGDRKRFSNLPTAYICFAVYWLSVLFKEKGRNETERKREKYFKQRIHNKYTT